MGNFVFKETKLLGAFVVETKQFGDHRGYFMETYRRDEFEAAGLHYTFVQDNQSCSNKGVLRGMHFQKMHPQAKLVRVIFGEVFDVIVDLRKDSMTYGQWEGIVLSNENHRQLLVPKGFAHGFQVLSDMAVFAYKCDDVYHPEDEGGIIWNDPDIGILWPDKNHALLSDKDKLYPQLSEIHFSFETILN